MQFLHDELNKLGFNNLEKVDVLKHASIVRDPATKESVIPFKTRPTKSGEMKDLAWEKIHQGAQGHFIENNLQSRDVNHVNSECHLMEQCGETMIYQEIKITFK